MSSLFSPARKPRDTSADIQRALSSSVSTLVTVKPSYTYDDMRRAARKNIWCVCSLFQDSALLKEAVIVDVSKTGARVKFRHRGHLPPRVRIKAGRIGLNRLAEVVWQTPSDAGLRFIPSGTA